jgi:ribose-phosphate pyrophosphokinase
MIRLYTRQYDGWTPAVFTQHVFSGGEPHITLSPDAQGSIENRSYVIDARVGNMTDLVAALVLNNAVKHHGGSEGIILLPYVPGGRQDRIAQGSGNGFTLKVIADILVSAIKDGTVPVRVATIDPHSDVTGALLHDYLDVLDHAPMIGQFCKKADVMPDFIINPDAGAEKRNYGIGSPQGWLANDAGGVPTITATKHRDPADGRITEYHLPKLPGRGNYLVVDDLCDGGRTFIALAEAWAKDPVAEGSTLSLWVTHGIFSQGYDELLKHYGAIGSTDSFPCPHDLVPRRVYRTPILDTSDEERLRYNLQEIWGASRL